MKVVLLGNTKLNYSWFIKTHRQGLKRNGVEVFEIDYKSNPLVNIKQMLMGIKADYVFEHLTFHTHINPIDMVLQIFKDVKNTVGTKFIHSCNDARFEDRYMGDISDVFHSGFVGTYPMVENCSKAWKIPVFYSPYSSLCYSEIANPVPELSFADPIFTGSPNAHRTGWADNRAQFIEDLMKSMRIKIFRTQSSEDLRKYSHELSASARCILGLVVGYEINHYIDVRPFQYLGSGACMIMRKFPNTEDIIPDDLYYSFDSYGKEGVEAVQSAWKRIQKTNTWPMRRKAFNYIQQNHSCKIRLKQILECIEKI